jgi:hypothetical protein
MEERTNSLVTRRFGPATRCLEARFRQGVNLRIPQVGGRSGYPSATVGDRSFPRVLARMWHGLEPKALDSRSVRNRTRRDASH